MTKSQEFATAMAQVTDTSKLDFDELVKRAIEKFNTLPPEAQEEHLRIQRENYVKAELELSRKERETTTIHQPRTVSEEEVSLPEGKMFRLYADIEGKRQFIGRYVRNADGFLHKVEAERTEAPKSSTTPRDIRDGLDIS